MNPLFYVYELRNPETNEIFYVGKGSYRKDGKLRLSFHLREATSPNTGNRLKRRIIAKILREGNTPAFNIIGEYAREADAFCKEKELIALHGKRIDGTGSLANITDGGDGSYGLKHSNATREKMSINNARPMLGKKHSEEARARMSKSHKENFTTGREKPRYATAELLSRMRREASKVISKPVHQICPETGWIIGTFDSCAEACRTIKGNVVGKGNINNAAIKKRNICYGFFWRFVIDYDISEDFVALYESRISENNAKNKKIVIMTNAETGTSTTLPSLAKAVEVGFERKSILRASQSKKSYNGFYWEVK